MPSIDFTHISVITFLLVYLAGFLTSFTPCVYPMIPIVMGYLGNLNGNTKSRAMAAVLYILGMSLVYALLGLIAAVTGSFFGELTVSWPLYLGFGIFLLVLGGSQLDFYNIPLPTWLSQPSQSSKNSLLQAFLVGATSALVASPCTAPVLGTLLVLVATQKQIFAGSALLFTFAIGMNTLLFILGISAGFLKNLPRSGNWMIFVKKILAGLVLASGVYFIFKAGQIY